MLWQTPGYPYFLQVNGTWLLVIANSNTGTTFRCLNQYGEILEIFDGMIENVLVPNVPWPKAAPPTLPAKTDADLQPIDYTKPLPHTINYGYGERG